MIAYNTIDAVIFFKCQRYNWVCTHVFRVMFIVHDFILFTVCTAGSLLSLGATAAFNNIDTSDLSREVIEAGMSVKQELGMFLTTTLFSLVTFSIGVTILVSFCKIPRSTNNKIPFQKL